jgi:hypothetical protein
MLGRFLLFEIFLVTGTPVSQGHTPTSSTSRLAINFFKEELKLLVRAKELLSHTLPEAGYAEISGGDSLGNFRLLCRRDSSLVAQPNLTSIKAEQWRR